jgi:hypothetical protein
MSDPTQIGVRVWRIDQIEWEDATEFPAEEFHRGETLEPYLAIPLDAATLADLRERLRDVLIVLLGFSPPPSELDAILAALGLEAAMAP